MIIKGGTNDMGTGESDVANVFERLAERTNTALAGSRIVRSARALTGRAGHIVENSSVYRWLTKEPEPDIIVIDLRETYTVGPFIKILDSVVPHVQRAWRNSRCNALLQAVCNPIFDRLGETRAYELAVKVLAPPDPPEPRADADQNSPEKD